MAAKFEKTAVRHRILGNTDQLNADTAVHAWMLPSAAQVDAMPELPEDGQRSRGAGSVGAQQSQLPSGVEAGSTHEFIYDHQDEAADVLRTMLGREETPASDGPLAGLTERQIATAFLRTIGGRLCLDLAHRLGRDNLLAVVQGIARDADTTRQTGMHALELVRERILSGDYVEESKHRLAEELERPIGKGQSRAAMDQIFGVFEPQLDVLDGFSPEALAPSVSREHPQTMALILRPLPPELAAGVISRLPEPVQGDVAHRMAMSEQVSADALQRVWWGFIRTVRSAETGAPWTQHDLAVARERCVKTVAELLNFAPASSERAVLNHLDTADALGDAVRNAMFTFADIVKMSDRDVQIVLRQTSKEELVVALKSSAVDLTEKFLGNMSERVRGEIREEMKVIGAMRLSEIEAVQLRIVQKVRQLEEQGEVTIVRGYPGDPFVDGGGESDGK